MDFTVSRLLLHQFATLPSSRHSLSLIFPFFVHYVFSFVASSRHRVIFFLTESLNNLLDCRGTSLRKKLSRLLRACSSVNFPLRVSRGALIKRPWGRCWSWKVIQNYVERRKGTGETREKIFNKWRISIFKLWEYTARNIIIKEWSFVSLKTSCSEYPFFQYLYYLYFEYSGISIFHLLNLFVPKFPISTFLKFQMQIISRALTSE